MTPNETSEFSIFLISCSTRWCGETLLHIPGHGPADSQLLHHICAIPLASVVPLHMCKATDLANAAPLDDFFVGFFLVKITSHLAGLTPYFSPLACQEDSQPPIPIPACTKFCKSPFGNTRASHLTFLLPPLSPHFPRTSNPHSHLSFLCSGGRSFRVTIFWAALRGWVGRECGLWCWKVLTTTKWFFDPQTITEGLLTRHKGLLSWFLPSASQMDRNVISFSAILQKYIKK